MTVEVRQRTISVRLAGKDDWTTRRFGEVLPTLDPFGDVPIETEIVKPQIRELRDFFMNHGSGRIGCGLSKNTPEAGISVHGLAENGHHVIFVQTDEHQPNEPADRSLQHRFYLYPNNVGIRRDVDFLLRFDDRLAEPDVAISENILGQKFVTEEDLAHLNYVKSVLASDQQS